MIGNQDRYTPAFKAEVALAALRGGRRYPELAAEYGVATSEIAQWVAVLEQGAEALFRHPGTEAGADEIDVGALYQQIGRLMMERDALVRRCESPNENSDDDDNNPDRPDVLIPQD
ncbi:MAG: helix-turn-helix domain-containing protein [Gammaproteobacteria bacterium]|jgi:putative transposase|nr:helix-turn-helix domain-containing protein [Gammaproteobacteria bacterium]